MMQITVKPTLDKISEKASKARKGLAKFKAPYRKSAVYLDRWVQENFKTEGGKVGGWNPLAAGGRYVTRGGKRFLDTSAKILQHTGRLRVSHIPFASSFNAGIGSDLPYAKKHNEGEGNVPQRRTLPKRSEIRKDIKKIFNDHAKEELKKAFGL